jgi:hypothetical protein
MPATVGSSEEVAQHTEDGSKSGNALSRREDRHIAEIEARVRKSTRNRLRERGWVLHMARRLAKVPDLLFAAKRQSRGFDCNSSVYSVYQSKYLFMGNKRSA